jgi:serine/threonine-protein kinase
MPIGTGGMARVYLARAHGVGGFEREVALKLMHAHLRDQEGWALDLLEEAKLAARIRHPNVVGVLDVGQDPQGVYLVMDYVHGDVLSALMKKARKGPGRLPPPIALRILLDALAGLHAAHELRDATGEPVHLVHRDFSPQNVLVGTDGVARLTDFGIAKAASRVGHTRTGLIKGKFGYMSPEQARGLPLDRRSDVWAAGVIAWELFAGQRLFDAPDDAAKLIRVVSDPVPRLRSVRPDAPPEIEEVIARALQRDVSQRTPTAVAFAQALTLAWRSHGPIADVTEVAKYVRGAVENELDERRAVVETELSRRVERADEASEAPTVAQVSGTAQVPRPKLSRRVALAMAAAVIVVVGLVVGLRVLAPKEAASSSTVASATASVPAASPPLLSAAPSAPAASASVGSVASASPVAPDRGLSSARTLVVDANAPVASLDIAGRAVALAAPRAHVTIELQPDEATHDLTVTASATDGRHATVVAQRGQGHVALVFRAAPRPRPSAPAAAPAFPFAENPYNTGKP